LAALVWQTAAEMEWFGTPWISPFCEDYPQTEIPLGTPCGRCDQPITADDRGVSLPIGELPFRFVLHLDCLVMVKFDLSKSR